MTRNTGKLGKVGKAASIHVDSGMTVAEAFELVVHACLKHYGLNEALVIRGRSAEALHQVRVAMRRLRSAFSLFKPAIEDVEFQYLRQELRWFTAQLGEARDLDVFLERDHSDGERSRLAREREQAYDRVVDAMNSRRFRRLRMELEGWMATGAWRSGKLASRPISNFANRRLDRLWQLILRTGAKVHHMDESTRHQLRIQVKKMRYAVEFLHGLYRHAHGLRKRFAHAIEGLQESLGGLNDLATAKTFGDLPVDDGWLIGSMEERNQVRAADESYRSLRAIGPFWRPREHAKEAVEA